MNEPSKSSPALLIWLRALRVKQWTKNGVVFAALIFAYGAHEPIAVTHAFLKVAAAALCFSLLSSAVYLFNDLRDRESDRAHPLKKFRPIASGELSPGAALAGGVILAVGSLAAGGVLALDLFYVMLIYFVMQLTYTLGLKKVALLDVFVIAAGFVLRALAGGVVIDVPISPWLVLCAMLLALFLALCKRRHEKVVEEAYADQSRPTLKGYDEKLLDQLIAIVSSATVVCYALYTLWPDTIEKFGTNRLSWTIPFVLFGLFRYLDLVYRHKKGGRPEQILLTDVPLMIDLALYGLAVIAIVLTK